VILRSIKRIEYRSRPTKIIGEPICTYAARKWAGVNRHDSAHLEPGDAPTGVIVGVATITRCVRGTATMNGTCQT
jgi:hypothetical protein